MIPSPMPILYRFAMVLLMNLGAVLTDDGTASAVTWCAACLFAATSAQEESKG